MAGYSFSLYLGANINGIHQHERTTKPYMYKIPSAYISQSIIRESGDFEGLKGGKGKDPRKREAY